MGPFFLQLHFWDEAKGNFILFVGAQTIPKKIQTENTKIVASQKDYFKNILNININK